MVFIKAAIKAFFYSFSTILLLTNSLQAAELTAATFYDALNRLKPTSSLSANQYSELSYQYVALGNILLHSISIIADTDSNGLPVQIENGGCTDSFEADTDDDGIIDGNEDLNLNGSVDPNETDPCLADTDGDGIFDGTERGLTMPQDPAVTLLSAGHFFADADPASTTDPTRADTDGDLISDGVEDVNKNGRIDDWEVDPSQATTDVPADLDNDGDVDGNDLYAFTGFFDPTTDQGKLATFSAMLGYTGLPVDIDGDGILSDGDYSGIEGDYPCPDGVTILCDDNCPCTLNSSQTDSDGDGIGDACDTGIDFIGTWHVVESNVWDTCGVDRVAHTFDAEITQVGPDTFSVTVQDEAETYTLNGNTLSRNVTYPEVDPYGNPGTVTDNISITITSATFFTGYKESEWIDSTNNSTCSWGKDLTGTKVGCGHTNE